MDDALWTLWAKSDAGGSPHSLAGHLLDAGAVAELIWSDFLAPQTRQLLDRAANGRGRDLIVLACALHDIGKATPAFQVKDDSLWAADRAVGFDGHPGPSERLHRQHWRAGAWFLRAWLRERGAGGLDWLAPVIEGHHGRHESPADWAKDQASGDGDDRWLRARNEIAEFLVGEFSIDVSQLVGERPSRATQLGFAGHVVMADWIASSNQFNGVGARPFDVKDARRRATTAWRRLGFARGWAPDHLDPVNPLARFAPLQPRPLQTLGAIVATSMDGPGLVIVEAPMGEGKTEAGLAMAEVMAARNGCDGVLFAMPTQGTTDAMYARVVDWASLIDPGVPVSLLHGKAMMNEDWRRLMEKARLQHSDDDQYGMASIYGEETQRQDRLVPAPPEWVLGRHRGLLSHVAVATIDQVLYAATRTKFVSVRHAGLAGKVLIIDEVHSYDVYMSTFLDDLLSWCAQASVPVILMSATLAPALRGRLISAFRSGLSRAGGDLEVAGYPSLTTVTSTNESTHEAVTFRPDIAVHVKWADGDPDDLTGVAARLDQESAGGGCVLVILNTVARAQTLYRLLAERGTPCRLIHGRLTTAARADRTDELVAALGGKRHLGSGRPERLVVVATQIAEQSFDVDVDWLVSDLAPMDLLLQRIGRLHRHERPIEDRPSSMRTPRVLILGAQRDSGSPAFGRGLEAVYGRYPLLKSAALIGSGAEWSIPSQVPELVGEAYDANSHCPEGWRESLEMSQREELASQSSRAHRARSFRLTGEGPVRTDLAGLHERSSADTDDEARTVRDGDPSTEAALVVATEGGFTALDGTPIGPNGERCSDPRIARLVWGDTVRLRRERWTDRLLPLAGWAGLPMVAHLPALVLTEGLKTAVDGATVTYNKELGLLIDRHEARR